MKLLRILSEKLEHAEYKFFSVDPLNSAIEVLFFANTKCRNECSINWDGRLLQNELQRR